MKVYTDKRFVPENTPYTPLLFPFWGFLPFFGSLALDKYRFEHYVENGAELFSLSSLKDCRFALLPFQWEQVVDYEINQSKKGDEPDSSETSRLNLAAEHFTAMAAAERKPAVVFFSHDSLEKVPLENSIVFRTSMSSAARRPNEYAMPYWMPDEISASYNGAVPLREKKNRPVVGFCGYNPIEPGSRVELWQRLTKTPVLRSIIHRVGLTSDTKAAFNVRAKALEELSQSNSVSCSFIFRDEWFNGVLNGETIDLPLLKHSRRQFVANLFESDYILCTRGSGNCSIRFYETLSSGRIPVFVNTDCVLPFEEWIDWREHCVWIEEEDIPDIADKVAEFHERLSPGEFKDRQRACRRLWLEWLSPYGFFKNFRRYFE